ncbi:MAG: hypothetical protein PHY73_02055 [Candidatus Omnitrophica bacterium]|nr:hypothetical protein [Candidatus Omnitrophota bacterium]
MKKLLTVSLCLFLAGCATNQLQQLSPSKAKVKLSLSPDYYTGKLSVEELMQYVREINYTDDFPEILWAMGEMNTLEGIVRGKCNNCNYCFNMLIKDSFITIYTCPKCGQLMSKTEAIGNLERSLDDLENKMFLLEILK